MFLDRKEIELPTPECRRTNEAGILLSLQGGSAVQSPDAPGSVNPVEEPNADTASAQDTARRKGVRNIHWIGQLARQGV